jgi:hypothetical protein
VERQQFHQFYCATAASCCQEGPEWPSPHNCTSSVWDELKFIPNIGSPAGIEVGSLFFPPSLTSRLPIKKTYSVAQAFQTPTTYLTLHVPTFTLPKP